MIPDCELLRQYAEGGDEAAFAELVRRYVDLVYSAAWRQVGGDAHLAQDAAQDVFTQLAKQARRLCRHPSLAGWLYTTARYAANNLHRRERRRRTREQEAYVMQTTPSAPEPDWAALQPVLDEAVCSLAAADREVVLLRFFQNKHHGEVGSALGLSEDAARKRVERALEKLRNHFSRRGVTVSTALLAAVITANSVQAAPANLAATLAGGALTGAGSAGWAQTVSPILIMTIKTKLLLGLAVFLTLLALFTVNWRQQTSLTVAANVIPPKTPQNSIAALVSPLAKSAESPAMKPKAQPVPPNETELRGELADVVKDIINRVKTDSPDSLLTVLEDYGTPMDKWTAAQRAGYERPMVEFGAKLLDVLQTLSTEMPTYVNRGPAEFFFYDIVDPVNGQQSTFTFYKNKGKWYLGMDSVLLWDRETHNPNGR